MANRDVSTKLLESALNGFTKSFGEGFRTFGVTDSHSEAISTGHDDLDELLTKGARGIFLGGIVEVMGSEGSGKTSLALRTIGNAQKAGHHCCWFDAEASFEPNLAVLNGCDPTKLLLPDLSDTKKAMAEDGLSFFNSAEILQMIYKAVASNVFGLVVLDSVAGLMPQRVLEDNFDPNSSGMAELARNMATNLPKIAQACNKTKTSVIFINQLRDQPGVMYGDRFHTPGGRALKFFAHQRISVEKIKSKEGRVISADPLGNEVVIGHYARVNIVKNRKAPPVIDTTIEIPIYYREYFPDDAKKAYDCARKLQVITIRNNVLTWKEEDSIILQAEGESGFLKQLRERGLEPQLSASCVTAAANDKNLKRKPPIQVPNVLVELSKKYAPQTEKDMVAATGRKRKTSAAIEL